MNNMFQQMISLGSNITKRRHTGAESMKSYFLDCSAGSGSGNAKLIRMPPTEQATYCRPFTA